MIFGRWTVELGIRSRNLASWPDHLRLCCSGFHKYNRIFKAKIVKERIIKNEGMIE
jgi:hypothetical protein